MTNAKSWDWTRVIFDHVHLRVADLERSRAFYTAALEPLGILLLLDTPELVAFANLALSADKPASTGVHVAFTADSREAVDAFHAAAIAASTGPTRPTCSTPTAPTSRPPTAPSVERSPREAAKPETRRAQRGSTPYRTDYHVTRSRR